MEGVWTHLVLEGCMPGSFLPCCAFGLSAAVLSPLGHCHTAFSLL